MLVCCSALLHFVASIYSRYRVRSILIWIFVYFGFERLTTAMNYVAAHA